MERGHLDVQQRAKPPVDRPEPLDGAVEPADAQHQRHAVRHQPLGRRNLITTFVDSVEVVAFDQKAADRFGPVAMSMARRGAPIGTLDTLMAAHALSLGLTFVTNNTQHFGRVPGLRTENWV